MIHTPGYHKIHSFEFPGIFCNLFLRYFHFLKQSPEQVSVFFVCEIINECSRYHSAYAGDVTQFLCRRIKDPIRIIPKSPADHLCIRNTYIRNSQTVDKTRQRGSSGRTDAVLKILVGFFPKSFHIFNLFFITVEMKKIRKILYISVYNKFFHRGL